MEAGLGRGFQGPLSPPGDPREAPAPGLPEEGQVFPERSDVPTVLAALTLLSMRASRARPTELGCAGKSSRVTIRRGGLDHGRSLVRDLQNPREVRPKPWVSAWTALALACRLVPRVQVVPALTARIRTPRARGEVQSPKVPLTAAFVTPRSRRVPTAAPSALNGDSEPHRHSSSPPKCWSAARERTGVRGGG